MYPDVPGFCAPTPNINSEWAFVGASPITDPTHRVFVSATTTDQQAIVQQRLVKLMEETGRPMIQNNGQRRLGPPAHNKLPEPGRGCEVFIGRIPRNIFEDTLYPVFSKVGRLYELRLMMDFSGTNRGFGFALYATPDEADHAVEVLDGYEILPGKFLGVVKSVDNRRLFVGGLPKDKTRNEVWDELKKLVSGINDVIIYSSVGDKTKSRGFAFVEFESHRSAAIARRRLIPGSAVLWDQVIQVDWAEPEPEVPAKIMAAVRVLYMRNLMLSTSEETIRKVLLEYVSATTIEKVKKIKDFAFLHFTERIHAETILERVNGRDIEGSIVTVVWAKPAQSAQKGTLPDAGSDINPNEKKTVLRGAGGLRKVSVMHPKLHPPMKYYLHSRQAEPLPGYQLAVNGQSPPAFYMSNWQMLLMVCRQLNLEEPRFEVFETSFRDRLVHFAKSCEEEVVVPCSEPSCRLLWKFKQHVIFRVTLPGIPEPHNIINGALCDTPEIAQENAAELALRSYSMVYPTLGIYAFTMPPAALPPGAPPSHINGPSFF